MSSLTGNKRVFVLAFLAAGFAVMSLALVTPAAFAQNATMPGGNQTTPGGNATMPGGNTTQPTSFEGNAYQATPPMPGGNQTTPGGNATMPGGNTTS
nr:hypothetical protein [uncultured Nitrososphaera sp.]